METFDLDEHVPGPELTLEYVLAQVDDVLIFRYYLGNFVLGKKMKSPLRKTKGSHLSITLNHNWMKLQYKDWGSGEVGDCFKFVSKLRGITYGEAIRLVACDFGLVKGCSVVTKKQIQEAREFKEAFQKQEYLVQVAVRPYSQAELNYWAQYSITKEDLKFHNIYAIKTLWVNKQLVYLRPGLHFAYYFPEVDKFKIYSPYEKEWKWFGNVSSFQMEGVTPAIWDKSKPIIVTKSRKDRIILSKLYSNVCSCQNEAETAIPKEMDEVFNSFGDIVLGLNPGKYCWFDSDEPGKNANRKLNHRGYKWINVPNELYEKHELKDPSDVIKHFGWDEGSQILINEIKKKGLL